MSRATPFSGGDQLSQLVAVSKLTGTAVPKIARNQTNVGFQNHAKTFGRNRWVVGIPDLPGLLSRLAVLSGILILLGFQLLGEVLHQVGRVPLPGPVIGMFLLLLFLLWKPQALSKPLDSTARLLFELLGLLFVPAGVDVIANVDLLRAQWVPILVGLIGSTILSLVVTAYLMHRMSPPTGQNLPRSQSRCPINCTFGAS